MIYDDHDDIYCWTCLILIYDDLIWYVLCFMICFMIWYDMFNLDIWWSWWYMIHDDDIYCWTCLIFMLMLMLDLWLQAETPGVTHFGAYHRPPDGHFCQGKNWPRGHFQEAILKQPISFPTIAFTQTLERIGDQPPIFNYLASHPHPHPHPTHPKNLTKIHGSHVFLYFCISVFLYFRMYFCIFVYILFVFRL